MKKSIRHKIVLYVTLLLFLKKKQYDTVFLVPLMCICFQERIPFNYDWYLIYVEMFTRQVYDVEITIKPMSIQRYGVVST